MIRYEVEERGRGKGKKRKRRQGLEAGQRGKWGRRSSGRKRKRLKN